MKRLIVLTTAILALTCTALGAQESKRMVVVRCENVAESNYETMAKIAVKIGATHFDCSQVEPSMWQWSLDRTDPYPCWSMHRASLFKYILPEELKPYIPADYVERNFKNLQRHGQILRKYGLGGFISINDPAWLPEKAYREHPEWRGPRCDQARRARNEYYAPCIDNAEIRRMYVESIAKLCKAAPVEMISILCNDSGAGLCWYDRLYPGPNGPSACKHISVGDRALDFLNIWQEGAAKAGIKQMRVNLGHTWGIENDVIPRLKEGQSFDNKTAKGGQGFTEIGTVYRNDHLAPVFQMPRMVYVCKQLQKAQKTDAPILINIKGPEDLDIIRLLEKYLYNPVGDGAAKRFAVLEDIAAGFVGADNATELVNIWESIENACHLIGPYNTGGRIYDLGSVHQRWITRPFVPFPAELEGDDLHYWRDFIFQAQGEKEAMDMTNLQAHKWLGGYGGYFLLRNTSRDMLKELQPCVAKAQALQKKAVGKDEARYLEGLALRLRMAICIVNNALNAVEFQWFMDDSPVPEGGPVDTTPRAQFQGDQKLVRMNQLVRQEIDNCYSMISILDEAAKAGIPVIITAPKKEFEQVLFLGPDLQDQLRHKITIMEDHRRDFLRIWRSRNL